MEKEVTNKERGKTDGLCGVRLEYEICKFNLVLNRYTDRYICILVPSAWICAH